MLQNVRMALDVIKKRMTWEWKDMEMLVGWSTEFRVAMQVSPCIGHTQGHPQVLWFTRMTHLTENVIALMAKIYYRKRIQSRNSKGEKCMSRVWRKPGNFQESSPSRVHRMHTSNNELWQHMQRVVYKGSSLETKWLRFLLATGQVGILCSVGTKIVDRPSEGK